MAIFRYNVPMLETLLRTKLYIPPLRPNLVPRPRLIAKLNGGLDGKLTLVSAPAGFGKSTLLSAWVQQAKIRPHCAYLSLDEGDNDLTQFLIYFVAALQTIEGGIGKGLLAALQSPETVNVEVVLITLLNEVSELADGATLILDDYHTIESQPVDQAIGFLIEHLPPQMQLVVASRIDPSLPLSRLRASGQMSEIRAHDLRFTPEEAALFLNQAMSFNLSTRDIAALAMRTEGWIAGLQLAALSIQGFERSSDIAEFVNKFTGSDRYIQDYLADEVLQQRPKGTSDFLLQTSILARLSASLCDAVTEQQNSQTILESLETANLFIVPLDNERHWFRYHHLFADLLAHRLKQTYRKEIPELHRRASVWYESEGYIHDSIHHANAAGDMERVADILEDHWQDIVHQGEIVELKRLLDSLGPEYTRKSAPLSMAYCWIHVFRGDNVLIPDHIKDIRVVWNKGTKSEDGQQPMKLAVIPSLVETMKASVALDNKLPRMAKEHAQKAISLIPANASLTAQQLLYGAAGYRLAYAYKELGEYDQACALFLEGLEMLKASKNYLGAAATVLQIVTMYEQLGKTEEGINLCGDTLDYMVEHGWDETPPSGILNVLLAGLQADWGDFEKSRANLELGRSLVEPINSLAIYTVVTNVEKKLDNGTQSRQPLVNPLSPRELEVLNMIAKGLSNREISEQLFLALDTVKGHNRNIYGKLGVKNRTQAVNKAVSLKIISQQ
jgi:LuxR family maltose regulon positive regulatory protein